MFGFLVLVASSIIITGLGFGAAILSARKQKPIGVVAAIGLTFPIGCGCCALACLQKDYIDFIDTNRWSFTDGTAYIDEAYYNGSNISYIIKSSFNRKAVMVQVNRDFSNPVFYFYRWAVPRDPVLCDLLYRFHSDRFISDSDKTLILEYLKGELTPDQAS